MEKKKKSFKEIQKQMLLLKIIITKHEKQDTKRKRYRNKQQFNIKFIHKIIINNNENERFVHYSLLCVVCCVCVVFGFHLCFV